MGNITISKELGKRIKELRTEKGMTIKDLADRIAEFSGELYSESTISMWESGKRRIYADQLWFICQALHCTPTYMFPFPQSHNHQCTLDELNSLCDEEYNILEYLFTKWNGNPNALVQFIGLYMSLPKQLRQDIAGMGIHIYELGLRENRIDKNAPRIDIDYIKLEHDRLWNWKQSEL